MVANCLFISLVDQFHLPIGKRSLLHREVDKDTSGLSPIPELCATDFPITLVGVGVHREMAFETLPLVTLYSGEATRYLGALLRDC
jgi:hypothetical protein